MQLQDGDLDGFLRAQGGKVLSEDEIMNKFVQICLSIHYVHNKVRLHLKSFLGRMTFFWIRSLIN